MLGFIGYVEDIGCYFEYNGYLLKGFKIGNDIILFVLERLFWLLCE